MKIVDWFLLLAVAALASIGVLVQTRLANTLPVREVLLPLVVGGIAGIVAAAVSAGGRAERFLRGRGPWMAWGVAVALMLALLAFGRRYRGGLYLPGRLNPSELVKFGLVAFSAGWLVRGDGAKKGRKGKSVLAYTFASPRDLLLFAGLVACLCGMVACAGDFGLLAQLALTLAAVLFVASWAWGSVAFALIAAGFTLAAAYPVGHLATRFAVWRDPLADMTGGGWQTLQGLTAVVSGGFAGCGIMMGDPEHVPIVSSDFVYAALAEELGLWGSALVLVLWTVVVWRGFVAAARRAVEGSRAEALLAAGISASLAVQVLLNVGGVLNALPMTGITLPLISRGGSSLATTLLMCGVLLGLSRRGEAKPEGRRRA